MIWIELPTRHCRRNADDVSVNAATAEQTQRAKYTEGDGQQLSKNHAIPSKRGQVEGPSVGRTRKRARGLPVAVPLRTDLKQRKRQKPVPHPQRYKRTVARLRLRSSEHCIQQQNGNVRGGSRPRSQQLICGPSNVRKRNEAEPSQ